MNDTPRPSLSWIRRSVSWIRRSLLWTRRNGLVLLFPALVLGALFLPSEPTGMQVGDSVPDGAEIDVLGADVQSLLGTDQPVVMEFWASWCAPCKKSVPALNAGADEFSDDVDWVAINVEGHLSADEVRERASDFGYRFAVGKAASSIQSEFSIEHLPTLLVVYRGRVTYRHAGVVDGNALAQHLRSLLDTPL